MYLYVYNAYKSTKYIQTHTHTHTDTHHTPHIDRAYTRIHFFVTKDTKGEQKFILSSQISSKVQYLIA